MIDEEARVLLGFLPNSSPSSSQVSITTIYKYLLLLVVLLLHVVLICQVKAAYKKKAWETHPDRFPLSQRSLAESNFKLVYLYLISTSHSFPFLLSTFSQISEAYTCLQPASGNFIFYLSLVISYNWMRMRLLLSIYVIDRSIIKFNKLTTNSLAPCGIALVDEKESSSLLVYEIKSFDLELC